MSFHVTKTLAAAVVALAIIAGQAQAQNDILGQWTFQDNAPADSMDVGMGPIVDANVSQDATVGASQMFGFHANATTDWTTPAGNGSGDSYSGNDWAVGDYFQFKTSSAGGFEDIGIVFDQMSSNTGPRDFKLQYSTDGGEGTFVDFGDPYQVLNGNWANFIPTRYTSFAYDLSGIAALENDSSIYFRLVNTSTTAVDSMDPVAATGTSRVDNITIYADFQPPVGLQPLPQRLPAANDVVYGMSSTPLGTTFELVAGDRVENGGAYDGPGPWPLDTSFIQSVMFDNTGGTWHNVKGNLLGVDFGSSTTGGTIQSFGTQGSIPLPSGQIIGNTRAAPDNIGQDGSGVTTTRIAGLSVSPDNDKIAVVGVSIGSGAMTNPIGTVIVYDYTAGNTMGSGASLQNGRDTDEDLLLGSTQGTAWLDNDTVIVAGVDGSIYTIDDNGSTLTNSATTGIPDFHSEFGSLHSAIAYNPDVSPLVFAMYSVFVFDDESTVGYLYVLDPTDDFNLIKKVDLSDSLGNMGTTAREVALDAEGNLLISTFGGQIHLLEDAAMDPMGLTDNSSVLWYQSTSSGNFVGMDIGFAPPGLAGDYNDDGRVDAGDYVRWRNALAGIGTIENETVSPGMVDGDDYLEWKNNYGNPGSGGGGITSVPEPTALALVLVGLTGLGLVRRRGC